MSNEPSHENEASPMTPASEGVVTPQVSTETEGGNGRVRKPTETVPSDRLLFEKHFETLRAFGIAVESSGGPVELKQAAQVMGMSESSIAVVLAFWTDNGALIRIGAGKYDVSEAVKDYVQALDWNDEKAMHKLKPLFLDKWFSKALLPRLRARPHTLDEGVKILAEAAGGASKHYKVHLERLITALEWVGLLKVESGHIHGVQPGEKPDEKSSSTPERKEAALPPVPQGKVIPENAPFLFLDRNRERKVTLIAPDSLTASEVSKIKQWLELVLFVEDDA